MITSQPDSTGHFGPYGGRFVPEVLMAPLEELEQRLSRSAHDPAFQAELADLLTNFAGPSDAALLRQASERTARRREDLYQARRSAAHRRAQNQQLPGPGAARAADGQETHHRRDRSRPARSRHGDRVRVVRLGVHRLHGRRGHAPPAPERVPHAAAGREGRRRDQRQPHAEGRHQRSHARLGDQRPFDALLCSGRRSARILIR